MSDINYNGGIREIRQVLSYVITKKRFLKKSIFYELIRTSNSHDNDIIFVFNFLLETKNAVEENGDFELKNNLGLDEFLVQIKLYYLNLLYSNEGIYNSLFNKSKIIVENDYIFIEIDSIPLKYRQYLRALIKLEIAEKIDNKLKILHFSVLNEIVKNISKKMSLEEFNRVQQLKVIKGEVAETFIFNQESDKLKNTGNTPIHMSFINIKAGYDILTYNEKGEEIYLEVKALTSNGEFYWSTNEINISKYYKDKYFLVLVNVENLTKCRVVKTIKDPSNVIFKSKLYVVQENIDYKITLSI